MSGVRWGHSGAHPQAAADPWDRHSLGHHPQIDTHRCEHVCTLPGYMPAGRSARCCGCGSAQRSDDVVSPFPFSALCSISCGCGTLLRQPWATMGALRAEGEALVPTAPRQHPTGSPGCSVSQPSGYLAAVFSAQGILKLPRCLCPGGGRSQG